MYAYVDRPLSSLPNGAAFLLQSMRRWVMAVSSGRCAPSAIGAAFGAHDLLSALPVFHTLMTRLNRYGRQQIRFASACCTWVTEDEAVLLAMAEATTTRPADVQATASLLVKEEAVSELTRLFFVMGDLMRRGAMVMTPEGPPA